MLRDNRVFFKPSATAFQDFSKELSDIHAGSKVMAFAAGDYLYLGAVLPFNHRYFDMKVMNDQASAVSVEIWDGNAWRAAIDIIDETVVSGASLGKNGIISWQIDRDHSGWAWDDTNQMEGSGLETAPKIFGMYWARVSFSAPLKNTTELNYVGHRFSYDEALQAEYPDLASSNLMTAFKAGKTEWSEQTLMAAEYIVGDLRGVQKILLSANQILVWELFEKASIHRTAMIVFKAFGEDYAEQYKNACIDYKKAMNIGAFAIDTNMNADLEPEERQDKTIWGER